VSSVVQLLVQAEREEVMTAQLLARVELEPQRA
jgi:hypothetical protein